MAKPKSQHSAAQCRATSSATRLGLRMIQRSAAVTGMGLQYVMKEARVFDVWDRLSTLLSSRDVRRHVRVVCKGGTALNKIFLGELQRFSEDLDFDAFFSDAGLSRSQKIAFLQEKVMSAVSTAYEVDEPRLMRQVVRFNCSFINEMGKSDSLLAEFNIETPLVGKIIRATATSSILRLPSATVLVYSFYTLVAKKLKTFYERESGKDIYDIYRSFEKCSDSDMRQVVSMLKEVLQVEGIAYEGFVSSMYAALSDGSRLWKVHASTNPYIPRSMRIDWGKAGREIRDRIMPLL